MEWWEVMDEHTVIRETCGYDVIADVEVIDLPEVIEFLTICRNYTKMQEISKNELGSSKISTRIKGDR